MATSDKIRVAQIAEQLLHKKWRFGTAESCTGGMIAGICTSLPGSSRWFEGGIVSYSNAMKENLLNVKRETLEEFGAVSEQCVAEMARGTQFSLNCEVTLSVSGIAGPEGGSAQKPVGTVCFGWALKDQLFQETKQFSGNREAIREQAATYALAKLASLLQHHG
ncbi:MULTISPECIES: CinA family protein [Gammaproteobacteria]|uniref:CinA family protein n=1 Tax=Gammaproteobacteria TaxID=1236 RepID=UPI000DD0CD6F|nr:MULTISPECIES: CinA family protein [Gammaproteobacteria]RTE87126.1 CinA family protein [Aliidiomarina sp. B3213]TCZ93086.1 CinA family protein [Lysobacter sp. N42]